jgi:glyoxylase-like metal-dependent hydrolase (beta-lactamase superfamily II)
MIHSIDLNFQGNAQTIGAFLVESSEGPILVETGPHSTLPTLQQGIQNAGFDWREVRHVLLSHIHLDHAGAAWAFAQAGAKIYVHPLGAGHLADPSKLMDSARRIYQAQMDTLWGDMQAIAPENLQTIEDLAEVQIGNLQWKAWHTPGHAIHHIAWQLDETIFTGDIAGVQIGRGPVIAPLPPPDIDLEQWQNSINLLKKINPKSFYLTHFDQVKDIKPHLEALEQNIYTLANWIKEHLQAGESPNEMTPAFDSFCADELRKIGLTEAEITQYQAANPAWMSVAGLARYWKKKLGN